MAQSRTVQCEEPLASVTTDLPETGSGLRHQKPSTSAYVPETEIRDVPVKQTAPAFSARRMTGCSAVPALFNSAI